MKQSRFTEEQIIGFLWKHETGVSVADLCLGHGVIDATVYKWKAKFGGMEVGEATRLKALEDENTKSDAAWQTRRLSYSPSFGQFPGSVKLLSAPAGRFGFRKWCADRTRRAVCRHGKNLALVVVEGIPLSDACFGL